MINIIVRVIIKELEGLLTETALNRRRKKSIIQRVVNGRPVFESEWWSKKGEEKLIEGFPPPTYSHTPPPFSWAALGVKSQGKIVLLGWAMLEKSNRIPSGVGRYNLQSFRVDPVSPKRMGTISPNFPSGRILRAKGLRLSEYACCQQWCSWKGGQNTKFGRSLCSWVKHGCGGEGKGMLHQAPAKSSFLPKPQECPWSLAGSGALAHLPLRQASVWALWLCLEATCLMRQAGQGLMWWASPPGGPKCACVHVRENACPTVTLPSLHLFRTSQVRTINDTLQESTVRIWC